MERKPNKKYSFDYEMNEDSWEYAISDKNLNARKRRNWGESREEYDRATEQEALNILTSL